MAIITSVINWKGGVGKTTLTHHLGTGLALRRKRILLLDLDPQCNLSYLASGAEKYYRSIEGYGAPTIKNLFEAFFQQAPILHDEVIIKEGVRSSRGAVFSHVDLVYAHMDLTAIDSKLARFQPPLAPTDHSEATRAEIEKLSVIKRLLDQVADEYDYIFLDCPPNVHPVTQNALFASDFFLIPAMPDHLSTVGVTRIREMVESMDQSFQSLCRYVGQPYRPIQCAGIVFNKVNEYGGAKIRAHQQYIDFTGNADPELVFDSYLVEGNGISDAAKNNHPVYAYANQRSQTSASRQIKCLEQILSEFLARVHKEDLQ